MNAKRYPGKLKHWNGERGFGFIVSDDSGQDLFVHISSFPRDGREPKDGEPLTFEIEPDGPKKKRAVRVLRGGQVRPTGSRHFPPTPARLSQRPSREGFGSRIVVILILATLGLYGYKQYEARASQLRNAQQMQSVVSESPAPVSLFEAGEPTRNPSKSLISAAPQATAGFRCDGRSLCSQMTSCEEAKRFLQNCPGMKMDGNNDGIPCEQQWCH